MERYIRGSVEFVPVVVTRDGTPTSNFEICVVPTGTRPEVFTAPAAVGTQRGYLIPADIESGHFSIYVKVNGSTPETPILKAGSFKVSEY